VVERPNFPTTQALTDGVTNPDGHVCFTSAWNTRGTENFLHMG